MSHQAIMIGAQKRAAKRIGVPLLEYIRRTEGGEKWCTACRDFHTLDAFGKEKRRPDGLCPVCRASRLVKKPSSALAER